MSATQPGFRKTRFVCVSDTHNQTPHLPKGDVLIHAGDLTNQGSLSELRKTVAWIEKADFEAKIVIAGNHDITLDREFYNKNRELFHNQHPNNPDECIQLLQQSHSITYLNHESTHVWLTTPSGPQTHFSVFGSPYSPAHGLWAFGYKPEQAVELWKDIPPETDVVVTHTPPKGQCDDNASGSSAGCEALLRSLSEVRPKLAICGHMHESRGVQRVRWAINPPRGAPLEESTDVWTDPGKEGRKQSLVDLTLKGRKPLDNHDFAARDGEALARLAIEGYNDSRDLGQDFCPHITPASNKSKGEATSSAPEVHLTNILGPSGHLVFNCLPETRAGRRETCIINAAIAANSWGGPKRFNKPIVVDIDLPI